MCRPLVNERVEVIGAGEPIEHVGEVPAGLLVLPGAGQEHRHLDVGEQRSDVGLVGDVAVVRVVTDLRFQPRVLQPQQLVLAARLVTVVDQRLRPLLAERGGLDVALLRPLEGEAVVEDAARVQRVQRRGVDDAERCDRQQARRLGGGDVQLADPRVGDSDHPDLVALHPRLGGDRLDGVVAVGGLDRLEVVERPAAAPAAAHVHADPGVAERGDEGGEPDAGAGRVARVVGGVLDDGRERPVGNVARKHHVDAQRRAVAHGQVAVSGLDLLVVEERLWWWLVEAGDLDVGGRRAARVLDLDRVRAGLDVAEQQRSREVDVPLGDHGVATDEQPGVGSGRGIEDGDLPRAGTHDRLVHYGAGCGRCRADDEEGTEEDREDPVTSMHGQHCGRCRGRRSPPSRRGGPVVSVTCRASGGIHDHGVRWCGARRRGDHGPGLLHHAVLHAGRHSRGGQVPQRRGL